jgi:spore maturation protein CgeB
VDDTGHPLVRRAMNDSEALRMAMQGVSHAAFTFWPDVVIFISGFFVTPGIMALLQSRRMKVVLLCTESPYQEQMQLERAQCADIVLLNDPVNIEQYRELGVVAEYAPHAYRPSVHYPRTGPADPDLNADLAFIGTGFTSRIAFFEKMNLDGLDVLLGGCWPLAAKSPLRQYMGHDIEQCVPNDETAEVYRNAKCGINFYRREFDDVDVDTEAVPWAMGPREIEQAACGMPFLRDPRAEGDEVLHMLPTFATPEDASEQLRWLLSHETEREKIARQAREAIQDRTFTNNAKRLLKLLED